MKVEDRLVESVIDELIYMFILVRDEKRTIMNVLGLRPGKRKANRSRKIITDEEKPRASV
jgi:hypothetical protein